ncbi:hypothetical protein AGMMS4956_14460 [Bacteroidia bacterium]|nr:hypothetical protein AGMMS4956_14460 [Bacteroidia bacterium]
MEKKGINRIGSNRVNRGGSWNNNAQNCRVANRNNNTPSNRNNYLGFRLVLPYFTQKDGCPLGKQVSIPTPCTKGKIG